MLGMAADIFVIISFSISLVLALLIAVPLAGTLVRFRANYNPKGLQLDGEGGVQPHTGPIVKSYFAMLFRVKRLEVGIFFSCALSKSFSHSTSRRAGLVYIRDSVRLVLLKISIV